MKSPFVAVDIAAATDFFRFSPSSSNVEFRRDLTVKLPLPVSPDDEQTISADDVAVCRAMTSQDGGEWTVLDGPLKLTRNSVAFDTRTLSKFCVVLVRPAVGSRALVPRSTRVADALRRVELDNECPRGDILPFTQFNDKRWTLSVHCVRLEQVESVMDARRDMSLVKASTVLDSSSDTGTTKPPRQRPSWRRSTRHEIRRDADTELRLPSGSTFRLELTGDVEMVSEDDERGGTGDQQHTITYHELVDGCCRNFTLVPKASVADDKVLTCILRVYKTTADESPDDVVRCFDFDVPPEVVAAYFYVPPPPPPSVPKVPPTGESVISALLLGAGDQPEPETVAVPPATPIPTPTRRESRDVAETFSRLTRSTRPRTVVPREPRVLSGRSLQCLARHISGAGIQLAVQLDIPGSVITGMTFDTLATGHTSADVTYRMLLLWKRRVAYYRRSGAAADGVSTAAGGGDAHVDMLVEAVTAATGNTQVADVIVARHRANRELTPDCFLSIEHPGRR